SGLITLADAQGEVTAAQMNTHVLTALQANVAALSAIVAEIGSCIISTTGHIRSGQTDYDTGDGWFLGHDGAEAAFSAKGGTRYVRIKPSIGIETNMYSFSDWGPTQTFTPTWTGFS